MILKKYPKNIELCLLNPNNPNTVIFKEELHIIYITKIPFLTIII